MTASTTGRRRHARALLRVAVACALGLAVTGRGGPSGSGVSLASESAGTYTLMQMNLCLSGFARCYGRVAYPAGVEDAVARIRAARPDAITINEGCEGDVARIARRTGYHLRFSTVTVAGRPLACVRPGGRGHFGDAVLTRAAIERADGDAFAAQAGTEWRRWLCVTTRTAVDVCTAHLAAGSAAQCAELAAVLERRVLSRTVVFGGDLNRRHACAPGRSWSASDASARQAPGLQSVSGSGVLGSPAVDVVPAGHTDHDVLLVTVR